MTDANSKAHLSDKQLNPKDSKSTYASQYYLLKFTGSVSHLPHHMISKFIYLPGSQ